MSEQQQVTEEQFVLSQRMESLARQNAQQALRIADLEAQIALIQAKAQQPEQPPAEDISDEDYEDVPVDTLN
jgi:hypothetical protein